MYSRLFIFVEGPDDRRFFNKIILPLLETEYTNINIYEYAEEKNNKVNSFIYSIKSMGADYLWIADNNHYECFILKKEKEAEKFSGLSNDNIVIVIKEIESWYLAGLTEDVLNRFGIDRINNTEDLAKEDFNRIMPAEFDSRIDFMQEVLKNFSIATAIEKNDSFRHFYDTYLEYLDAI